MSDLPANDSIFYTLPSGKTVELLNYRRQPNLDFILMRPSPGQARQRPGSLKKKKPLLFVRDGSKCHYCRVEMTKVMKMPLADNAATIEHIVARAHGGPNSMDNLVLACNKCNHSLGDSSIKCRCDFCGRARNLYFKDVYV